MIHKKISFAVIVLALFSNCGQKVDVGNNVNYDPSSPSTPGVDDLENGGKDNSKEETIDTPVDLFAGLNYTTSPAEGIDPNVRLTCFGPSPVVPNYVQEFCDKADDKFKTRFATSYKKLCEDRTLVNLFRPSCSWTGEGE